MKRSVLFLGVLALMPNLNAGRGGAAAAGILGGLAGVGIGSALASRGSRDVVYVDPYYDPYYDPYGGTYINVVEPEYGYGPYVNVVEPYDYGPYRDRYRWGRGWSGNRWSGRGDSRTWDRGRRRDSGYKSADTWDDVIQRGGRRDSGYRSADTWDIPHGGRGQAQTHHQHQQQRQAQTQQQQRQQQRRQVQQQQQQRRK